MRCDDYKHTYERSQDLVTEIVRKDLKIIANNREVIIETSNRHIEVPITVCEDLIEGLITLCPCQNPVNK